MSRRRSGYPRGREPRDRPRHQALRRDARPRRPDVRGPARRSLRLPRRQRRRQDDDDAHLPGHPPCRRGRDALGRPADGRLPRRTWGYLPEERGLYPRMAVLDQLVYFASLYGAAARRRPARGAARGWPGSGSPTTAERRAEELSKGNQQKVQFIAAVLHEPYVLLMDEPFTGLDPVNLGILREAFLELRDEGRTLIFSTHQMEAAEALCESVAIVDRGRVVAGGTLARAEAGERAPDDPARGSTARRRRPGCPTCRVSPRSARARVTPSSSSCRASSRPRSCAAVVAPRRDRQSLRDRRAEPRDDVHRARRTAARGRRADGRGPTSRRPRRSEGTA